jgi:hypothetical protein
MVVERGGCFSWLVSEVWEGSGELYSCGGQVIGVCMLCWVFGLES